MNTGEGWLFVGWTVHMRITHNSLTLIRSSWKNVLMHFTKGKKLMSMSWIFSYFYSTLAHTGAPQFMKNYCFHCEVFILILLRRSSHCNHLISRASSSMTVRITSRSVISDMLFFLPWSALNNLTKLFSDEKKHQQKIINYHESSGNNIMWNTHSCWTAVIFTLTIF